MPPTERLYYQDSHLIEFDARATASLFGGTMTLIVNVDGSLSPAPPDRGEPFVRVP